MMHMIENVYKIKVSIIVCARNEEKNINNLIDALLMQNYNKDLYEIIVANDQSFDETESILKEYGDKITYFNVEHRNKVLSPKKNALTQAIKYAKGEILLLTDADCIPCKNWINSHVGAYFEYPATDMVVGLSKTLKHSQTICQIFEHVDFLILMFAAQGAIQAKMPFSASGQNLSYKKSTFEELNGFENLEGYISGDDLLLLQKFVKNGKNVQFAAYDNGYTETQPVSSWKELFNQRARWASNMKVMLKMNPRFFIYLVSCFMCIGILPFISLTLYGVKAIFDIIFVIFAVKSYQLKDFNLLNLIFWLIISPFYILIVTIMGIFSIFKWKGRKGNIIFRS